MLKILLFILLLSPLFMQAQELHCRIQVSHQQIQGTNVKVFETLQTAIYEFMNNKKWTDHIYSVEERIECNITINLTEQISVDEFKGTIQIQSTRPVFNTSYNSVIFNYMDPNFQIKYVEFQTLDFSETSHMSNLTSILAYYAYIIIGLDYDTFSAKGGYEYFQKAEKIVNNAQGATEKGWKAFDDLKNRYWLVENLLNDVYSPIRDCYYVYHRQGLDQMSEKAQEGRALIAESLEELKKIHASKPGSFLMQLFFTAKSDEIINIFSDAYPDEKVRMINLLSQIDPMNSSKYSKMTLTQDSGPGGGSGGMGVGGGGFNDPMKGKK